jgi:hypothetical protein
VIKNYRNTKRPIQFKENKIVIFVCQGSKTSHKISGRGTIYLIAYTISCKQDVISGSSEKSFLLNQDPGACLLSGVRTKAAFQVGITPHGRQYSWPQDI